MTGVEPHSFWQVLTSDVAFWVAVAFVGFLVLTGKPIARFAAGSLDKRSAKIEAELAEAIRLREEAQATLAAYQKKQREVHAEAEAMIAAARETARLLEEEAKEKLRQAVESRVATANAAITRSENLAIERIQRQVVDTATESATRLFEGELNDEAHERLFALAVKDSGRLIH